MTNEEITKESKVATTLLKALAVIGLVAILALVAWMSIQVVRVVPDAASRITSGVVSLLKEDTTNTVPSQLSLLNYEKVVNTGDSIVFNWTFGPEGVNATYAFSYACADGASFSVQTTEGEETVVHCEEPYEFITTDTSIVLTPESTANRYLDVTVTFAATADGVTESTTTLYTIVNEAIANSQSALIQYFDNSGGTTTATSTDDDTETNTGPAPAPTPGASASVAATPADLSVKIDATGISAEVDGTTTFFATNEIPENSVAAVKFTIENIGGTTSGVWSFNTYLPIDGDRNYLYRPEGNDFLQEPLRPGEGVTFTLSFDELVSDEQALVRIELLPTDTADDSTNNTVQKIIKIKTN